MSRRLICVVDDDTGLREALCDLFVSASYDSVGFDCAEALLSRPLQQFDCVLTDLHMTGMGGLALLRILKSRMEKPVVIVMTADPRESWRRDALAGGAAAFVPKPFDAARLLSLIAGCLSD